MLKYLIVTTILLASIAGCNNSSSPQETPGQSTGAGGTASVNEHAAFYRGKNVSYIVTTNAGGGYDAYARLIGKYLSKYLGASNVIINNLPGGGHIVGTNTLWRSRPDGLTIGTFNAGLIYNQIIGVNTMQFDIGKFSWIGKAAGEPRSLVVSELCHIKTMEDLIASTVPVKIVSAGIGSASYTDTKLLAEAFALNIEIIPGFEGSEGKMSMMRGEVCGQFGTTSSIQPFVDSGYGHFILTVGGDIEGVPRAIAYAQTERAKSIIALVASLAELGRVTAGPPGMDVSRLEYVREAYRKTLEDPGFLAEAEKMMFPITPSYGDEVTQLVVNALDQPPETVEIILQSSGIQVGQ